MPHLSQTMEQVRRVRAAFELLAEGRDVSVQRGGELRPDGSRQMPWYSYDPVLTSGLDAALDLAGSDPRYLERFPALTGVSPAEASLQELGTWLTYVVRGERFSDGHIAGYVRSGELQGLFGRLLELVPRLCETPRLRLRELTEADLPALREILQDEQTMTAYEGAFDEAMTVEWLQRALTRYRTDGFALWAVELKATGRVIGQCGITRQHILGEDVLEVGYLFNRAYWHHGYATEAARACMVYAFSNLGAERVWAQVRDTNLASMNVAIRLGMTVRGRFEKQYRGVTIPHLAFARDAPPVE